MFKRVAVAFLVLLPLTASAQVAPRLPGAATGGISVGGRAVVRVPVKTLRFIAQARGNADENAVIAAMRAAGVDEPVVGPAGSQIFSGTVTTLRGVVRDVSQAKLERIAAAAADYVRTHPGTTLDNVNFSPRLDDCAAVEQSARIAALADAQRKAAAVAAATGMALAGVVAVNESGGCPTEGEPYFNGGQQAFDLGTLTTSISIFEQVTYAIAPADGARRRTL